MIIEYNLHVVLMSVRMIGVIIQISLSSCHNLVLVSLLLSVDSRETKLGGGNGLNKNQTAALPDLLPYIKLNTSWISLEMFYDYDYKLNFLCFSTK